MRLIQGYHHHEFTPADGSGSPKLKKSPMAAVMLPTGTVAACSKLRLSGLRMQRSAGVMQYSARPPVPTWPSGGHAMTASPTRTLVTADPTAVMTPAGSQPKTMGVVDTKFPVLACMLERVGSRKPRQAAAATEDLHVDRVETTRRHLNQDVFRSRFRLGHIGLNNVVVNRMASGRQNTGFHDDNDDSSLSDDK